MNHWTDSDWILDLESETKSEIESKHLHHKDMTNKVNNTNNWK